MRNEDRIKNEITRWAILQKNPGSFLAFSVPTDLIIEWLDEIEKFRSEQNVKQQKGENDDNTNI